MTHFYITTRFYITTHGAGIFALLFAVNEPPTGRLCKPPCPLTQKHKCKTAHRAGIFALSFACNNAPGHQVPERACG